MGKLIYKPTRLVIFSILHSDIVVHKINITLYKITQELEIKRNFTFGSGGKKLNTVTSYFKTKVSPILFLEDLNTGGIVPPIPFSLCDLQRLHGIFSSRRKNI